MKNHLLALITVALLFLTTGIAYGHGGSSQEAGSGSGQLSIPYNVDQTIIDIAKIHWQPLKLEGLAPGAEIAILRGDLDDAHGVELLLRLPPGYVVPVHNHVAEETYVWIKGAFTLIKSDGTKTKFSGPAYISFPGNAPPHGLVCGSQEACVLYLNYSRPFDIHYFSGLGKAE
jgi:hypothetical protein